MKKLHKTGTTILLALAPACALGVVAGVIVANMPKQEAKPIIDPSMSGEVDIEVSTDGRGHTLCTLTTKDQTKQVGSVVVTKGGVTLGDGEYEWNKEGQYVSISPDVMEQYPGQLVIKPNLEDKEKAVELKLPDNKPSFFDNLVASSLTTKSTKLDLTFDYDDLSGYKIAIHLVNENGQTVVETQTFTLQYGTNNFSISIPENALKDCTSVTLLSETTLELGSSGQVKDEIGVAEYSEITSLSTSITFKLRFDGWIAFTSRTFELYIGPHNKGKHLTDTITVTFDQEGQITDPITLNFQQDALKSCTLLYIYGEEV